MQNSDCNSKVATIDLILLTNMVDNQSSNSTSGRVTSKGSRKRKRLRKTTLNVRFSLLSIATTSVVSIHYFVTVLYSVSIEASGNYPPPPPPKRSSRTGRSINDYKEERYIDNYDDTPLSPNAEVDDQSFWYEDSVASDDNRDYFNINENKQSDSNLTKTSTNTVGENYSQEEPLYENQRHRDVSQQKAISNPPFDLNKRTPIHYQFQSTSKVSKDIKSSRNPKNKFESADRDYVKLPETFNSEEFNSIAENADPLQPNSMSARNDQLTRQMSTFMGRIQLAGSCALVGTGIGIFIGKSLGIPKIHYLISFLFVFAAFALRHATSAFGEVVRALGMTLILLFQQSRLVRKKYSTIPHLKALLLRDATRRRPFPPTNGSLWSWKPNPDDRIYVPYFNLMYATIAMGLVGSIVGGNFPLLILPTWLGSIAGACLFAYATTLPNSALGDLARISGMRVVSLALEVKDINEELGLIPKIMTMSGKIFDKLMIMDRKHRIKDRIVEIFMLFYQFVARIVQEAQGTRQEQLNPMQGNPMQGNPMQRNPIQRDPIQRDQMQRHPMPRTQDPLNDERGPRMMQPGSQRQSNMSDSARRENNLGDMRQPPDRSRLDTRKIPKARKGFFSSFRKEPLVDNLEEKVTDNNFDDVIEADKVWSDSDDYSANF